MRPIVHPWWLLAAACLLFSPIPVSADQDAAATEEPAAATEEPAAATSIFPDKALEKAVRAEVFEKRYNDEPITAQDVQRISRVVGRGLGIRSLQGLEHCKAVMLLDLTDNVITDLTPITDLTLLQSVTLANNQITDLAPLAGLEKMQLLDLADNSVTDLSPITAMQNLRTLWVADNQLTSIEPVKSCPKIWSLDVAGNRLTDLTPAGSLSWLTTLEISDNKITSLQGIEPLDELDMLIAPGNQLVDLHPLVEMCRRDATGTEEKPAANRFAPYLKLYLSPDQLDKEDWAAALEELRGFGVRIESYQRQTPVADDDADEDEVQQEGADQ